MLRLLMAGGGENVGLSVQLTSDLDNYISYTRPIQGVLLAIHSPEHYAELNKASILQPGVGFNNFIYPSVVTSEEAVGFPQSLS